MERAPQRTGEDLHEARESSRSEVAEVIGTAMTASRPKTRYLVGRDAKVRRGGGQARARTG